MKQSDVRAFCWRPLWNPGQQGVGLEQLLLSARSARSVLLGFDDQGCSFCLRYFLAWGEDGLLREADLHVDAATGSASLRLQTDGAGHWMDANGSHLAHLDGCQDIDIWPTPFTNSLPLWRSALRVGERREYQMAWVSAPELTVVAQLQAYTRISERAYLFENLDGSGFRAGIGVDADGLVLDYPGFFERVPHPGVIPDPLC